MPLPFHILGPAQGMAARAALLVAALLCGGCVTAGVHNDTTTERFFDGLGKVVREIVTKRQGGNYTDTRAAGQDAMGLLSGVGGLQGLVTAVGPGGLIGVGASVLGLLGIAHRSTVKSASLKGQSDGYTQAQVEHAGLAAGATEA